MTHSNRLLSLLGYVTESSDPVLSHDFEVWSPSLSLITISLMTVDLGCLKFFLFEWAWFDSVCVYDLNELCLKEIIRIWFLNGLVWNWGRRGEKRNNVTPKKWFAIGDLWIGVSGMWLSFSVKDRWKWWKSLERKFDYQASYSDTILNYWIFQNLKLSEYNKFNHLTKYFLMSSIVQLLMQFYFLVHSILITILQTIFLR